MDIIVTTPKSQSALAKQEAEQMRQDGYRGYYFRTLATCPKDAAVGGRVFYVEDGYIRGFGVIEKIEKSDLGHMHCATSGRKWTGYYLFIPAKSWQWIKPIKMKGFQGWRYFSAPDDMQIVGSFSDPKPNKKHI